ncbi:MAG: TIGR02757 family protein [Acidobacteria bacterium]|nr:TIGR02757 family protein [Acidobacteriota bacterium]
MKCNASLKTVLDNYFENFHYEAHLSQDPVQFAYRFSDDRDREIAALFAAAFAYGNVAQILKTLEWLFGLLGASPYRYIRSFSECDAHSLQSFYHRFNTGRDIIALCLALQRALKEFGNLQNLFLAAHNPKATTIEEGLCRFVENLLARVPPEIYRRNKGLPAEAGVRFLLPSPASGSACKRMNLFLRWMVRPGPVDFRVWKEVEPRQLVLPVDTHIARIGQYIGLTKRTTIGWKMALEMTATLRLLDSRDPVRYDFALCHLGIMRGCPAKHNPLKCAMCPIQEVCTR